MSFSTIKLNIREQYVMLERQRLVPLHIIATALNLSVQRVQQIQTKAIQKLWQMYLAQLIKENKVASIPFPTEE